MVGRKRGLYLGVGINDIPISELYVIVNGIKQKRTHFYTTWSSMLTRAYGKRFHERQPTYLGCSVCDEWHTLSNFRRWYDCNYIEGYELDKDLLFPNNKVYSPHTCNFIPKRLNTILTTQKTKARKYPQGVSYKKATDKYVANIRRGCITEHIGVYNTPEEASIAYNEAKAVYVIQVCSEYLLTSSINKILLNAIIDRYRKLLTKGKGVK